MALLHCVFHIETQFMKDERLLGLITDSVTKGMKPHGFTPVVRYPDLLCGRTADSIQRGKTALFIGASDISGCVDEQHLDIITTTLAVGIPGVSLQEDKPVQITGTLADVKDDETEMKLYHSTYDDSIDSIFAGEFNRFGNYEPADIITKRLLQKCFIRTRLHYLGWQDGDPVVLYLREQWQRCMSEGKISVGHKGTTPMARWNANSPLKIVALNR